MHFKVEIAKRLRDRLIKESSFELTMQVATKSNLESFDVWYVVLAVGHASGSPQKVPAVYAPSSAWRSASVALM
jgi:uncharacterized FAD-dependent dehydrogenase